MKIGQRGILQVLKALGEPRHYHALKGMMMRYHTPFRILRRYLTAKGHYPIQLSIKTDHGVICPTLYSYHDLLTANEIFCREDYLCSKNAHVIIDIGSNIGLSALYFLTKSCNSFVYLYEPLPSNVIKLAQNIHGFQGRYALSQTAVADFTGEASFGVESTGRYGGIDLPYSEQVVVPCVHINDILATVLQKHERIDILKLDIEGYENKVLSAIDSIYLKKIEVIYAETPNKVTQLEGLFQEKHYGTVARYQARS